MLQPGPSGRAVSSAISRAVRRPGAAGRTGGSSRTMWALVPPKPKELTPARAGPSWAGQETASVGMVKGAFSYAMAGLTVSRLMWGGITRCLRASAVLMSPAMPAADSVCPMLVLTDPTWQAAPGARPSARTWARALASMGSPTGVEVPWASTYWRSPGVTPASAQTRRTREIWASALGTVMPLVRPSWLTPLPRMTACTGSPSASASSSRLRATRPTPSARTYPSAEASKARERPLGERKPPLVSAIVYCGAECSRTPPASARSLSPRSRLWQARWTVTREELHAVSTVRLGPLRSRQCEIRFDTIVIIVPVAVCAARVSKLRSANWRIL
ncbi:hypothetical protein GA0115236_147210 [Streptomyces sp. IgraMP-1]|nr:hypothetical protein GA0115236_147210 [Streptomyces sp. IgraMP-1]